MSRRPVLEVSGLGKKFARGLVGARRTAGRDIMRELAWWRRPVPPRLRGDEFWALEDVSFTLREGESLGVIGANGAGKSTLLKVLSRLLKPDAGAVRIRGRVGALIELGAGFNPVLSGRENVFAQGALYGLHAAQVRRRLDAIIAFADLDRAIDVPLQQYSSGMRARLGFAVAVHIEPQLLLVDEVLAVGDLSFQNKCMRHMHEYLRGGGTLVFVGHAGHQVQAACERGIVLVRGRCSFDGPVVDALDHYFRSQRPGDAAPVAGERGAGALFLGGARAEPGISIDSIAVDGRDGGARSGAPVDVVVRYTAERAIPSVTVFGAFYSVDGQRTLAGAAAVAAGGVVEGRGEIRMRIAHLPFAEGSFQLRVALIDRSLGYPVAHHGWLNLATRVSVSGDATDIANFARMIDVPLMLPSEVVPRA